MDGEHPADHPVLTRRRHGKQRRKVVRVLVATVLALALVLGAGVVYLYFRLNGNLNQEDFSHDIIGARPTKPAEDGPKGPVNILVMGSDTRDCDGCRIDGVTSEGGSESPCSSRRSAPTESSSSPFRGKHPRPIRDASYGDPTRQ